MARNKENIAGISWQPLSEEGERLIKAVTTNALNNRMADPEQIAKLFEMGALSNVPHCRVIKDKARYVLRGLVDDGQDPVLLRLSGRFRLIAIDRRTPQGQRIERVRQARP